MVGMEKVIVIEPSDKEGKKARYVLKKAFPLEKVYVINLLCFNNTEQSREILKLRNENGLKIFHGCAEDVFKNMINSFGLNGRRDFKYINQLDITSVVRCYWNFKFEKIKPTISVLTKEEI